MGDIGRVGPSPEVIERIKRAIAEAETIEEVTRLERALKSGILPEDLKLEEKEEAVVVAPPAVVVAPPGTEAKDVEMRPVGGPVAEAVPVPATVAEVKPAAPAAAPLPVPASTVVAPPAAAAAAEAKPKITETVTVDDDKAEDKKDDDEPAAKK